MSKGLDELARKAARVQGPPAKKEEDGDESGPVQVLKAARVVSGRTHHRLRMSIDPLMCRDGKLEDLLLERKAVNTLAARRIYQTAVGAFLKCVKEPVFPLVGDVEIDDVVVAHSNDCFVQGVQHHHGSQLLAAVMDRWPSCSRSGSRKLSRFHQCLKEWRQLALARTRRAMQAPVWKELQHSSLFSNISIWWCSSSSCR